MSNKPTFAYSPNLPVPVQIGVKHRMQDGRVLDLLFRRVKEGNETPVELAYDGPRHASGLGRFSTVETLMQRLDDIALSSLGLEWAKEALLQLFIQAQEVCRYQPELWRLFVPKGKFEIYTPEAKIFSAQYIPSNFTLKCHADTISQQRDWLLSGLAQHLDYPFGPGERRFSTSRLFDLCFVVEKLISPRGLAAHIDRKLEALGVLQSQRHTDTDYAHASGLLQSGSAAIRTSYERVLQRERFKALIGHWYGNPLQGFDAPVLEHYRKLVELDLAAQAQQEYKGYPARTRDDLAESLHLPLAMIFAHGGANEAARV